MAWFDRFRRKRVAEHERVTRQVGEMLDPYAERTVVFEGDRAMMNPGQILENIYARMGRIDLDPDTEWSPEDVMSLDEGQVMFQQLAKESRTLDHLRRIRPWWSEEDMAVEAEAARLFDVTTAVAMDVSGAIAAADRARRGVLPEPFRPTGSARSLMIRPEPSSWVLPEHVEELRQMGFEVRSIPGAGHSVWYGHLDEFMSALDSWI